MKLTGKQLQNLKKIYDKVGADIGPKMAKKLKDKGLIDGWPDHYFVTEKGQRELIIRYC